MGGILLLLGVATRVVACLFAVEMLVTTLWVKVPSAGWNASDLDRMLLVACVLLVLAGPGAAALDRLRWEREERVKDEVRYALSLLQRADEVIEYA